MAQTSARIVSTQDTLGGEPRIAGSRISVLQIYELVEGRGDAAETVAGRYNLDVADVYHALAYYHDNVGKMTEVRRRRWETIETHRDDALTPDDLDEMTTK